MESKFKFQINRPAKDLTPDEICKSIMGKSIAQFVRDIQINKNGEYDCLFITEQSEKA